MPANFQRGILFCTSGALSTSCRDHAPAVATMARRSIVAHRGRGIRAPTPQGGLDGEIRAPPLPTPLAAPAGRPGSDRFRGHPHRHIAAVNEGPIAGRPIRNAVLRLIRGMNLRLHPCSVAPAETRRAGQTAPPAEGLSCNNATSRRPPLLVMFAVSSAPTAGGGLPPHPRPRGARTHVRTRTSPPPSLSRTGCRAAPGDPP